MEDNKHHSKLAGQMGEWLKQQMAQQQIKGIDIVKAYEAAGVKITSGYVSNMRNQGLSVQKAVEIATLMGWEPPTVNTEGRENLSPTPTHLIISTLTPQAGSTAHNNEHEILEQVKISTSWLKAKYPNLANLGNLALCNIRGDSMEPTFDEEDTILVDRTATTFEVDGVYVFTYHDSLLIKRIQSRPGRGFIVISDNKDLYESYNLPVEDLEYVRVHGRVVGKFSFNKV